MGKPTALRLAMATLRDAPVVDVRRREGEWWIDTHIDQPGFSADRYVLVAVDDMERTLKRMTTAEDALQLARLMMRKR